MDHLAVVEKAKRKTRNQVEVGERGYAATRNLARSAFTVFKIQKAMRKHIVIHNNNKTKNKKNYVIKIKT